MSHEKHHVWKQARWEYERQLPKGRLHALQPLLQFTCSSSDPSLVTGGLLALGASESLAFS